MLLDPLFASLLPTLFVPLALLIFLWSLYTATIFVVGMRRYFGGYGEGESKPLSHTPFISLIVPAKDEERAIPRLLDSLIDVEYPKEKMEILIVEDGSSDRTGEICRRYASNLPKLIRYFHRSVSSGKPAALNFGLQEACGDIVGILDADSVPRRDLLRRVATRFEKQEVIAIQGITQSMNAGVNMLTKIVSREEAVWLNTVLNGKDHLGLFVPLTGTCQFIRTEVLRRIGGWDEASLAEDVELAVRLLESGHHVKFCEDVISFQEAPSNLSQLFTQRLRWYRGYIETAIRYGTLLRNPSWSRVDAETYLLGPIVLSASFANYLLSWAVFTYPATFLVDILAGLMAGLTSTLLVTVGFLLVYLVKPRKISSLLWLPFIYVYWFLQMSIATYALFSVMLRRPRIWTKTEKTG